MAERQPARILLVDDDAPTRRVIRLIVKGEGYELAEVASREDALVALQGSLPSVVIMDYMMPGLSAGEFIDEVRARGFTGPIILCTAMSAALDLPVDEVLVKPFDPDDLVAILKRVLLSEST